MEVAARKKGKVVEAAGVWGNRDGQFRLANSVCLPFHLRGVFQLGAVSTLGFVLAEGSREGRGRAGLGRVERGVAVIGHMVLQYTVLNYYVDNYCALH